jgi:DNA-binding CsgD family transcriptional regulator
MQHRLQIASTAADRPSFGAARASRDDALHSLYAAVGDDDRWNDVLRVFASYFDANISMLVVAGQGQRDKSFYAAFNHREEAARAYSDYWWQHDAVLQAVLQQGQFVRGMVGRGSDVISDADLHKTAYYKEFLVTMPAEHFLGCVLSDGGDAALAPPMHLSFFRPPGTDEFSDAEVSDLADLYPHIHRAFELHWQLRSTQEQLRVFHQSLDGLDFGVLFVDPASRVRHANLAARNMIGHPDWTPLLGGLNERVPAEGELAGLMQSCALGSGGAISLGLDGKRVFVLALPLASPVVTPGGETRASVMLMLIDPQKKPEAALDFVVRAFGLSKAEARLLPLLIENRTPADIAQSLNVKISTVRSQLSAIFAKTGTTRQQELIRLLGTLPPIQRLGR